MLAILLILFEHGTSIECNQFALVGCSIRFHSSTVIQDRLTVDNCILQITRCLDCLLHQMLFYSHFLFFGALSYSTDSIPESRKKRVSHIYHSQIRHDDPSYISHQIQIPIYTILEYCMKHEASLNILRILIRTILIILHQLILRQW